MLSKRIKQKLRDFRPIEIAMTEADRKSFIEQIIKLFEKEE